MSATEAPADRSSAGNSPRGKAKKPRGRAAPARGKRAQPDVSVGAPDTPDAAPVDRGPIVPAAAAAVLAVAAPFVPLPIVRDVVAVAALVPGYLAYRSFLTTIAAGKRAVEAAGEEIAEHDRKLHEVERELATTKTSTDGIMDTVAQGLFLMRPDYTIDEPYSKSLEKILRTEAVRNANLLTLLQPLLTEKMHGIVTEYFTLLFDAAKKERTVLKVNPLARIEVAFDDPAGGFASKYLSFTFKRIMRDGEIWRVFFTVDDITANVEMETQIKEAENTKQRQFEFLLGILHVEPRELDDFIAAARDQLTTMSGALRLKQFAGASASQTHIYKQRLETVFRCVHTIKGHAQLLKFTHFVQFCHEFEDKITALRAKSLINAEDFLGITLTQAQLAQGIDDLEQIRSQFLKLSAAVNASRLAPPVQHSAHIIPPPAPVAPAAAAAPAGPAPGAPAVAAAPAPAVPAAPPPPPPPPAGNEVLNGLGALALKTAISQRKRVKFEASGFDKLQFTDEARRGLRDIFVQFVRNSVTHGVESPDERTKLGKAPMATLRAEAVTDESADRLTITFRDDGAGLDGARIRAAAIAKGVITEEEAATLTPAATIGLIFRPGFSTAEKITEDAGRGFGMDIVKEIVVDKLGGKLNLRTEPQKFTEFIITLPLDAVAPSAAEHEIGAPA